jgi:hypothetical protein
MLRENRSLRMLTLKTTSVITLTMAICAMASQASAQTAPRALETAHPVFSQSNLTVKSAEVVDQAAPKTRKIKRVVKPVPDQSNPTQPQQAYVSRGIINADTSVRKNQTRFIYNRHIVETQMPVYFSEEALRSK